MLTEQISDELPRGSQPVVGERFVVWTSCAISALPFLGAAGLCGSAAYIRSYLGRWPVFNRDSFNAPYEDAATLITYLAVMGVLLLPLGAVLVVAARWAGRIRPVLGSWALWFLVGWLLLSGLVFSDPVGFIDWALD